MCSTYFIPFTNKNSLFTFTFFVFTFIIFSFFIFIRDYERAVSSYATALVFAEDSFTSESKTDSSIDSTGRAEIHLIIALANAGLGMTYVKIKECSRALEHLKAGIGFLTDAIFIKQKLNSSKNVPFTCPDTLMTFTPIEISKNEEKADDNDKKVLNRILTLPIILSRAQHLLNALESLCDAYAELREWNKAIYTANASVNVCDGFLEQLHLKDYVTVATMSYTEDGAPIGTLMAHDDSNSNNNNSSSSRKCTLLFREDVILILHDELCKSGLENKCLDVERENFVRTMRKKRASAIHAKGHMMKKILHHDIRQDINTEDVMNQYNSGSRPFDSMDTDLSLERFYDTSGYDTTRSGISPAEAITSLWTEAALEYSQVGYFEKALLIYTDLADMWEGLGKIKPYCDSLFRIEDVSTSADTAQQDISDIASNTTALSSSKSVTDSAILSSDVLQHTIGANESKSQSESEQRIVMPLEPFTPENMKRIHAAQKAKSVWLEAADVASILCLKEVTSSDDLDDDSKGEATELSDPSLNAMNEDMISLESQMILCQQIIQYQYKAGVCALFYDMVEAELLLGRAQTTKEKYQDLAGRLEVAECGRQNVSKTSDVISFIKKSSSSTRDEAMKVKWLKYNTLCCDISFHLAYTYVRLKKIAYAIAEAEMAIGYAVQLSRSKSQERKRICWGVLALAFHASGQVLETERAMNEMHLLQSSDRSNENDISLELLSTYMLFSKVKKRMHMPESSLIASRYSYSKPVVQEENKSLLHLKSDPCSTSHTSYPRKGNIIKRFYNLLPYQIVVSFLFLLFSFLISLYCFRINAAK